MAKINIKKSILAVVLLSGVGIASASHIQSANNIGNNEVETASVAATTTNDTKDARPDDELLIWSPWSEGGPQDVAFRSIVDIYNEKYIPSQTGKDLMKVKVQTVNDGYSGITSAIQGDLRINNLEDLPDMYITYSDATASLIEFGNKYHHRSFALNMEDVYPGIKDQVIPTMAKQNEMITGGDPDAIYAIPFATSSELMGIDSPLVIWMLQQYIIAGGTVEITETGDTFRQILDAADSYKDGSLTTHGANGNSYEASNNVVYAPLSNGGTEVAIDQSTIEDVQLTSADLSGDGAKTGIETYWKVKSGADAKGRTITIDDNTFTSGEGMLKLSKELLSVVTDSKGNISANTGQAIFGYDSAVNNFYTYGQAETDSLANPENGLIYKDGDKVNYGMLEQDSDAWNTSAKLLDFFSEAFTSGAAWTANAGVTYGSNLIINHQLPFSIGSTAGASHYYSTTDAAEVNPGDLVFTQSPGKLSEDDDNNVQMQQGPLFGAVDNGDDTRNENIGSFMEFLTSDEKYSFETGNGYVTYSNFDEKKANVKNASGKYPLKDAVNPINPSDIDSSSGKDHISATATATGTLPQNSYGDEYKYYNIKDSSGNPINDYVLADSYYGIELYEWDSSNSNVGNAVSAPDAVSEENISTYMSSESNYIVGTKAVFEDVDYTGKLSDKTIQSNGTWESSVFTQDGAAGDYNDGGLIGPSIAYQNIQDSQDSSRGVELELEPYSTTTSSYRSEVSNQIKQMKEDAVNKGKTESSEDILIELHNKAIKNNWFEGDIITVWEWWMTFLIVLAVLTVVGGIAVLTWWLISKNKNSKNTI